VENSGLPDLPPAMGIGVQSTSSAVLPHPTQADVLTFTLQDDGTYLPTQ